MVPTVHDVIGAPLPGTSGVSPRTVPSATPFDQVLKGYLSRSTSARRPASPLQAPTALKPPQVVPHRIPHVQGVAPRGAKVNGAATTTARPATVGLRKTALRAAIHRAATSVGVDSALSLGVARAESNFNPTARSSDGLSVGTFQMTNTTANEMRRRMASHSVDRPAGTEDVALGVGYLRYLHDLFGRDARLARNLTTVAVPNADERRLFAVAAFNAGEGRVAQAQARARAAGGDPTRFADVKRFLPGITQTYVGRVADYARDAVTVTV